MLNNILSFSEENSLIHIFQMTKTVNPNSPAKLGGKNKSVSGFSISFTLVSYFMHILLVSTYSEMIEHLRTHGKLT